eukprot:SAG31_NODE_1306_length_8889_cov_17.337315_3_plen_79_part_00
MIEKESPSQSVAKAEPDAKKIKSQSLASALGDMGRSVLRLLCSSVYAVHLNWFRLLHPRQTISGEASSSRQSDHARHS